jgi:hypothetical protein
LLPSVAQPALPGLPAPVFFEGLEAQGEFTGDRLFHQRPDVYKAVVMLLAQRLGVIRIGKLLSVSPNTVMAVRDREGATIDTVKLRLADVAHNGALLASESILEALNSIAPNAKNLGVKELKELAVVYGILVQNGQLLAGQPTARVEMGELQKPQHEDFNRYLANLPTAQVIDIAGADSTGLAGEKSAAKSGAPGTADPSGAEPITAVPGERATDGKSIEKHTEP